MAPLTNFLGLSLIALQGAVAHPGHNVAQEAAEKADFFKLKPRTIRDCAAHLERRGVTAGSVQRRKELADNLRAKRGLLGKRMLGRRAFSDYNFSHLSSDSSISLDTDESSLFADNSSCTLQSEVTQGPYYVSGELIRQDVTDGQDGIPLYVDIQVIDTSTCEPISDVYMDFWHANATGVYSGVVANGNGDSSDTSNLDSTAMRGIQQTDANGLVQFITKFPGHYSGRATHIHIMTHNTDDTTAATNKTLLSDSSTTHASHVGQLFFDQDLITQVSQISPYSESTAQITQNSADMILTQEADTTDPFVEYVLLGSTLSDGLLAWISVGIDPTKDSEVSAASTYYESGGVANANSFGGGMPGGGMPGGGPGGNGTMPGGPGGNGTMTGGPGGNGTMTGGPGGNGTMTGGPGGNATTGGTPASSGVLASGTAASSGVAGGSSSGSSSAGSSSSSGGTTSGGTTSGGTTSGGTTSGGTTSGGSTSGGSTSGGSSVGSSTNGTTSSGSGSSDSSDSSSSSSGSSDSSDSSSSDTSSSSSSSSTDTTSAVYTGGVSSVTQFPAGSKLAYGSVVVMVGLATIWLV